MHGDGAGIRQQNHLSRFFSSPERHLNVRALQVTVFVQRWRKSCLDFPGAAAVRSPHATGEDPQQEQAGSEGT